VVRRTLSGVVGTGQSEKIDKHLASLLDVPVGISTALLLSLFICIDFPRLRRGVQGLRQTWLREVYEEMAPAFTSLGRLIGRAMHAQGLIALCNAILMFVALSVLGVAHPMLLSGAVFVLCLVPTLGMLLAWGLVAVVALIQPDGGIGLALKASAAVLGVCLVEPSPQPAHPRPDDGTAPGTHHRAAAGGPVLLRRLGIDPGDAGRGLRHLRTDPRPRTPRIREG
jgi:Predicted permease